MFGVKKRPQLHGPVTTKTSKSSQWLPKRLAVVIGNSEYENEDFAPLKNPENDAQAVKRAFSLLGFDVRLYLNRTHVEMLMCFDDQLDTWKSEASEIIVFYFGHGASIGGRPYLIPVDAKRLKNEYLYKMNLLGVEDIIRLLLGCRRNPEIPIIFILDCCRSEVSSNTHISEDLLQGTRNQFGSEDQSNVAILFSTSGGEAALDSYKDSEHGPFTKFLLEYVKTSSTLNELDMAIRKCFTDKSRFSGRQIPSIYHSLTKDYRFNLETTFSKASSAQSVFSLKYKRNKRFVDRPEIFDSIHHAIETNEKSSKCAIVVLCGLGGTGKSQIALEFCYRCKNEGKYPYIFWMAADTEVTLQKSFADAAARLNLTFTQAEYAVPTMIQWLEQNEGWLLIFDNASEGYGVQNEYFPKADRGVVIITTQIDVTEDEGFIIKMDKFEMDDKSALKVMLRKKDIDVVNADPEALKIVRELAHLPLAVDLAGAAIRMEEISPAEYLKLYDPNMIECLKFKDDHENTYGNTVLTALDVSFKRIGKKSPFAASLLLSIAILYPENIPSVLFEHDFQKKLYEVSGNTSLKAAIKLLCKFSLLRRSIQDMNNTSLTVGLSDNDALTIHRLVQKVIILQMDMEEKLKRCQWLISALRYVISSKLQNFSQKSLKTIEIYVPHIVHVSLQFAEWTNRSVGSGDLIPLLPPTIVYLARQAMFEEAEKLAKLAISNSEIINRSEHLDTAAAHGNLFYVYAMQRNFSSAERHGKLALDIRKKILGISNNSTRSSLHYLAYIYGTLGKNKDATMLFREAAEAKDGIAMHEMARRYSLGIGINIDKKAATKLYNEASLLPSDQLQRNFYEYGRIDFTPLHHIAQQDDVDGMQKRLKEYRQFVDISDEDGKTPLHHAAENGNYVMAERLISDIGSKIDTKDVKLWTPLKWALEKERTNIIQLLITKLNGNFQENYIGDEGARFIAECLKENIVITQLNLADNEISDLGIHFLTDYLSKNTALTELNLSYNKIGIDGACVLSKYLEGNINLIRLNIKGNNIGNGGARFLAECLKKNTTLTYLNLAYNYIDNDAADFLIECLKETTTLTELDLSDNEINSGAANSLKENLNFTRLIIESDRIERIIKQYSLYPRELTRSLHIENHLLGDEIYLLEHLPH